MDLLRSPWQPEPDLADEAKALIRAAYEQQDIIPADFDPEKME